MHEPLARCNLHAYPRVLVACIPPIVPYVAFYDGTLALMQNADLPVALYSQFTFKHCEFFYDCRMAVFSHDSRANKSGQFGGCAALRIFPGTLQDRGTFLGYWVLPYLANFYRSSIRRPVWFGVSHLIFLFLR